MRRRRRHQHLWLLSFAAGLPAGQAGRRGGPQGDRSRPPSSADASPGLQDAVLQQDTRPARTAPPRNPAAEGLLPRSEGRTCRPGAASLRKRSRSPRAPRTENLERLRHRHALLHRTAGRPGSSPRWNPAPPPPAPDRLAPGAAESLAAPAAALASLWLRCVGFGESGTDPARSPHGAGDCQGHSPPDPGQERVSAPCPLWLRGRKRK